MSDAKDMNETMREKGSAGVVRRLDAAKPRKRPAASEKKSEAKPQPGATESRPEIDVGALEYHEQCAVALMAISQDPKLYLRERQIVRVVDGRHHFERKDVEVRPIICEVKQEAVRASLAKHAIFTKFSRREKVKLTVSPPSDLANYVIEVADFTNLPTIIGVSSFPLMAADGSFSTTPGYDFETRYYYAQRATPITIPTAPTREDAMLAVQRLIEPFKDFPFADASDKASFLAMILTPFVRSRIAIAPAFVVDATMRGSGKSLLAMSAGMIVAGSEAATSAWPAKHEEMDKRLLAIGRAGEALVVFDNITTTVDSAPLSAALTSDTYSSRVLGSNTLSSVSLRTTFYLTSNNATVHEDMGRRLIRVRLESDRADPENRENFSIADLPAYVRTHRAELASAALTILAAYVQAGEPRQQIRPFGSFQAWSALVEGALVWCGTVAPRRYPQANAVGSAVDLDQLCEAVEAGRKFSNTPAVTARQLIDYANAPPAVGHPGEQIKAALEDFCDSPVSKITSRSLGKQLASIRGRWAPGGARLVSEEDRNGTAGWSIERQDTTIIAPREAELEF